MATSKQREWQLRQQAAGLCSSCGRNPATSTTHCQPCREKSRKRARDTYRLKKGIPLDAPIQPARPRIDSASH